MTNRLESLPDAPAAPQNGERPPVRLPLAPEAAARLRARMESLARVQKEAQDAVRQEQAALNAFVDGALSNAGIVGDYTVDVQEADGVTFLVPKANEPPADA